MDSRAWLGKAVNDTQMHPNNIYKTLYPENLRSVEHMNLPIYVKRVGMYAAALAIGEQTGLYEDLVTYLGPRSANLVMDYANVKHFFTSLGNEFFTSFGKQFFTLYGKEIFTSLGKQSFTLPDKEFFTFPVRWSAMPAGTLSTEHIRVLKPVGFSLE